MGRPAGAGRFDAGSGRAAALDYLAKSADCLHQTLADTQHPLQLVYQPRVAAEGSAADIAAVFREELKNRRRGNRPLRLPPWGRTGTTS